MNTFWSKKLNVKIRIQAEKSVKYGEISLKSSTFEHIERAWSNIEIRQHITRAHTVASISAHMWYSIRLRWDNNNKKWS